MTEYNLFCYSENYDDDKSFQQKRYRAFNKEVDEKRYNEILEQVKKILPKQGTLWLSDYWKSVTQEQWKQLLAIPEAQDYKSGFEYISDCKINTCEPSLKGKEVEVKLDGKIYKAIIQ